jgi:hypothetical protein
LQHESMIPKRRNYSPKTATRLELTTHFSIVRCGARCSSLTPSSVIAASLAFGYSISSAQQGDI